MIIEVKEIGRAVEVEGDIWYREGKFTTTILIDNCLFTCHSDLGAIKTQVQNGEIKAFDYTPYIWPSFADPANFRFKKLI